MVPAIASAATSWFGMRRNRTSRMHTATRSSAKIAPATIPVGIDAKRPTDLSYLAAGRRQGVRIGLRGLLGDLLTHSIPPNGDVIPESAEDDDQANCDDREKQSVLGDRGAVVFANEATNALHDAVHARTPGEERWNEERG